MNYLHGRNIENCKFMKDLKTFVNTTIFEFKAYLKFTISNVDIVIVLYSYCIGGVFF